MEAISDRIIIKSDQHGYIYPKDGGTSKLIVDLSRYRLRFECSAFVDVNEDHTQIVPVGREIFRIIINSERNIATVYGFWGKDDR